MTSTLFSSIIVLLNTVSRYIKLVGNREKNPTNIYNFKKYEILKFHLAIYNENIYSLTTVHELIFLNKYRRPIKKWFVIVQLPIIFRSPYLVIFLFYIDS